MLSQFLCHLVPLPLCMGLCVVRLSMSLGLPSVMYGSLCCPIVYVAWSHLRYVWFSMLLQFLCHLVPLPLSTVLYVVTVPMSLGPTSVLYGSLCCPIVYVTWSHFRYVWFSIFSESLYWCCFTFMFVIVLLIMADRSIFS